MRSAEYLEDDDAMMQFEEPKSLESEEMEDCPQEVSTEPKTSLLPQECTVGTSVEDRCVRHTLRHVVLVQNVIVFYKMYVINVCRSLAVSEAAVVPDATSGSGGKQSWLLRLFESKLFDMSYAVQYLFNSKESGVQTYIGNRIFNFEKREVDFYLQQLVNMYIHMHDVAEVIHPYLVRIVFLSNFP